MLMLFVHLCINVRQADTGVYKCVVSNPGGEVTCIAHLHIECTILLPVAISIIFLPYIGSTDPEG